MKIRFASLILSLFQVLIFASATTHPIQGQQDKASERELFQNLLKIEDPVRQLAALREFSTKYPKSSELPKVQILIVASLLETDAPSDELVKACEVAVGSIPKDFERAGFYISTTYLRVAEALNIRDDRLEKALEFMRKALPLLPLESDEEKETAVGAQALIGILLYKLGYADEAVSTFLKVLPAAPDKPATAVIWLYLSKAYEKSGNLDAAIKAYIWSLGVLRLSVAETEEPLSSLYRGSEESLQSLYRQKHGSLIGFPEKLASERQEWTRYNALTVRRYAKPQPEWQLNDLTGKTIKSGDFRGKITVMSFWGSWCEPCKQELKEFQFLYDKYKDAGIVFLAVDAEVPLSHTQRIENARRFLKDNALSFPVGLDLDDSISAYLGVDGFPTSFVIDKTGIVRFWNKGSVPESRKILETQIQFLSNNPALPPAPPIDEKEEATRLIFAAIKLKKDDQYRGVIAISKRVLALAERNWGPSHLKLAGPLLLIAESYCDLGDYQQAITWYERSVAVFDKNSDKEHLASTLHSLGVVYMKIGDLSKAESTLVRAKAQLEVTFGAMYHGIVEVSLDLGNVYSALNDEVKAEQTLLKAHQIAQAGTSPDAMRLAKTKTNLALHYHSRGDDEKAVALLGQAIEGLEQFYGKESATILVPLTDLAQIYDDRENYAKSDPLWERLRRVYDKYADALGGDLLEVFYTNLGVRYFYANNIDEAEKSFQQALAIFEKTHGKDQPLPPRMLVNLANIDSARGRYKEAIQKFDEAKRLLDADYGREHPFVAMALTGLTFTHLAAGNKKAALENLKLVNKIVEHNVALALSAGSETQKALYLDKYSAWLDNTISVQMQCDKDDVEAGKIALTAVFNRKGRVLDVMASTVTALRSRIETKDRALLDEWAAKSAQLATLLFQNPAKTGTEAKEIEQLKDNIERLEMSISAKSPEFQSITQSVKLEDVQKAIPPESLLVEFVLYNPYDVKTRRLLPARYVAYVLGPEGGPKWIELKDSAAVIEAAVLKLRNALGSKSPEKDVRGLAKVLYRMVMQPVIDLTQKKEGQVLISPDGQLNLIPFGVLVDEQDKYIIERYSFVYLTSGRDLLRLPTTVTAKQESVVVASPQFSTGGDKPDMTRVCPPSFRPLETSKQDAQALLPEAKVIYGLQATETALRNLHGPTILHIVTHGFFCDDATEKKPGPRALSQPAMTIPAEEREPASYKPSLANPMFRSGLALAGANTVSDKGDDGILSAFEIAKIDLKGTKLVVLSACDTGIGEIRNGEGVYGLRRALVLAGAESQIISLWKVGEIEVQILFERYYDELLNKGRSRNEALREVQRRMISDPELNHPYYWAGFIQSGAWQPLAERR